MCNKYIYIHLQIINKVKKEDKDLTEDERAEKQVGKQQITNQGCK